MEYSAELKTVATEFKCSFTKEIKNGKVVSIKRDLCVNVICAELYTNMGQ